MKTKLTEYGFAIMCKGCGHKHYIPTDKPNSNGAVWKFNGSNDQPTFTPSVNISWGHTAKTFICHFIITNGKIEYCADSTHALSGQTIDLPEVE
jgi:hypothetical protein